MPRLVRKVPWFQLISLAEVALLARRHLQALTPDERRRLADLVRHPRSLADHEREELRRLAAKLELRQFATGAAGRLSPVKVPGVGGRRRR
jgi:inactivated superfamily I helicase